jgi:hypothetical protein
VDDRPRAIDDAPNAYKSPAPPTIVESWCIGVERMNRPQLDKFTRRIWGKFEERDLGPLRAAILRRRRVLARQAWSAHRLDVAMLGREGVRARDVDEHVDGEIVEMLLHEPRRPPSNRHGFDTVDSSRVGDDALGAPHIPVKNMMCAFGVPGNMIHGTPGAAFSESPVDAAVAPGMYTT